MIPDTTKALINLMTAVVRIQAILISLANAAQPEKREEVFDSIKKIGEDLEGALVAMGYRRDE